MALTDETGGNMVMPVAPMYGGGNGGFGNFGGDGWWIILLFILLGNNGWGGYGNNGGANSLYPWMNQANQVNNGFRDQMVASQIGDLQNSVTAGFGNVQTSLCNGFAGTAQAITGAQNALAQQMYANQLADLERSYAAQTATTAGMTGLQSQLANCCCENRAGIADLRYTVATENCADRAAISDGIRDVITATQTQTQAILDRLTQDKLDEKNETIATLRQELLYSRGQASQDVQTARILAGQAAEVDGVYNRLRDCPVPTMPVYGMTPIFTCGSNGGCGCGGM